MVIPILEMNKNLILTILMYLESIPIQEYMINILLSNKHFALKIIIEAEGPTVNLFWLSAFLIYLDKTAATGST